MAIEFNLLSGATVDTELNMLYEILRSGQSYLGFSRNFETWGQGSLIRYIPVSGQEVLGWPDGIVGDNTDAQIYDENHRLLNLSVSWKTTLFIAKYNPDVVPAEGGIPADANSAGIVEWLPSDLIETIFINDQWILARGIDPTYEFTVYDKDGTTEYDYFIFNADKNENNILQIQKISEYQYPGLSTRVQLKYAPTDSTTPFEASAADPVPGGTDLERRLNIQGEYMVTGIGEAFINWIETVDGAKNATFFLVDVDGALLLDKFTYEETVVTDEETAYVFSYFVTDIGGQRKVRFKVTTLTNINSRMAVFNESLPVRSHIAPVADNNPPGFPVSYIRHPDIGNSIFDVVGAEQITQNDVWLCKELPQDDTAVLDYYTNLETTINDPDTLTIEDVVIDQDAVTQLDVTKTYAKSKYWSFAGLENFTNIMVDMELRGGDVIPGDLPNSAQPMEDIYRQIYISWDHQYYDPTLEIFKPCHTRAQNSSFWDRATFFNTLQHKVDIGMLVYVANKFPVYRKYIVPGELEIFKIVI